MTQLLTAIERVLGWWQTVVHDRKVIEEPDVISSTYPIHIVTPDYSDEHKLIYQNDDGLLEPIRRWGCGFRSLLRYAEVRTGRLFSVAQINDLYAWAVAGYSALTAAQVKDKWYVIDPNCTLGVFHDRVVDRALETFGVTGVRVRQVGALRPARTVTDAEVANTENYWRWAQGTVWQGVTFTLLRGRTATVTGRPDLGLHFRYGNRRGSQVFDPHNPSPVIREETAVWLYMEVPA